jgi:hypothetical protein
MHEENDVIEQLAQTLTFHSVTPEQWDYLRERMRESPQWYVVGKAVWKTDRWRALAGPFEDPQTAQVVADDLANDDQRDFDAMYRAQVKSLTELIKMYRNNIPQLVDDLEQAGSQNHLPATGAKLR